MFSCSLLLLLLCALYQYISKYMVMKRTKESSSDEIYKTLVIISTKYDTETTEISSNIFVNKYGQIVVKKLYDSKSNLSDRCCIQEIIKKIKNVKRYFIFILYSYSVRPDFRTTFTQKITEQ